jgi:hypothetical protein
MPLRIKSRIIAAVLVEGPSVQTILALRLIEEAGVSAGDALICYVDSLLC